MAQVVAIANQKGGVGKSTVSTCLAAALAGQHGLRTLLIDMDGQCNTTAAVLARGPRPDRTIKDALWQALPLGEIMVPSPHHERLFIIAGSEELSYYEKTILPQQWDDIVQESRQIILTGLPPEIDVVLIDTPPSLGLWLNAALGASDGCVMVCEPNAFSLQGITQLMATFSNIKETVNADLDLAGLIVNKVRGNVREHEGFLSAFRQQFGPLVFDPAIHQRVVFEESQRAGCPIEWYADAKAVEPREWFGRIARQLIERRGLRAATTDGATPPQQAVAGAR